MGKKNNAVCRLLKRPKYFADLINGTYFEGDQVLLPEQLEDVDRVYDESHMGRDGKVSDRERIRDVVKKVYRNKHYAIVAVENQDELNFIMPFRCMEYDVEDYRRQLVELKLKHKERGDLKTSAELLSGIKEDEKLHPVVTILFFHGKKKQWTTNRELHDMLDFTGNEYLRSMTANYKMNIITPEDLNEDNFRTNLREVIGMLKRRDSKKEMRKYITQNKERFKKVETEAYQAITVLVGDNAMENIKPEVVAVDGEECVNMCIAFEEMIEEEREEVLKKNIKSFITVFSQEGAEKEFIISKIVKIFSVTKTIAEYHYDSYVNKSDLAIV